MIANSANAVLSLSVTAAASTQNIGSLAGGGALGGNVLLGALNSSLSTGSTNASTVYGGVISGQGGFSKVGTGTTTMTGHSVYSGPTTISAGGLEVNGQLSSTSLVNVNANSFLAGSGSVAGPTGIASGATVTPGAIVAATSTLGTLGMGSLSLQNGSTYIAQLGVGGASHAAPGTSDRVNVNGSLTIAAGATLILSQVSGNHITGGSCRRANYTTTASTPAGVYDTVLFGANPATITNVTAAFASLASLGFNGGNWDGAGGLNSSAVADGIAAGPGYQFPTGIGYMSDALTGGTFLGRTVDAGSVVARYTYYGDANLDGVINGMDYSLIDSGFAAQSSPGFVYGWVNGDFTTTAILTAPTTRRWTPPPPLATASRSRLPAPSPNPTGWPAPSPAAHRRAWPPCPPPSPSPAASAC